MLLKDEVFVAATIGQDITMSSAEWSEEDQQFIYVRGCYVIRYEADDVRTEDLSVALNEEGRIVETTYQTLMSGEEVKNHKLLSDEDIVTTLKDIALITPIREWELWENKIYDPYDWDFVHFIIRHRPDLMI